MTTAGDLAGRHAVITGGSRGIGHGIARAYAKAGMRVTVASRRKANVDAAVETLAALGGTVTGVACDVGSRESVGDMVREAVAAFGPVDVLVNAAQSFGTPTVPDPTPVPTPLESFTDDEWAYTLRTGLCGTLYCSQAVFATMRAHGGSIINFGGGFGILGHAGTVATNVAKEGVRALTRTAAREWGIHGIRVNVIVPAIQTESAKAWEAQDPEGARRAIATIPLGRFGDAEADAGGVAKFLASDDARFITGMTFFVDGGKLILP